MAKNVTPAFAMFGASGCDMSQASTTSLVTTIQYQDNAGIIASWTGTSPVGTLNIDVSNDNFVTFDTLDFGSAIGISGNTGSHKINMNQLPFGYIRARYVKTSGTGTLTCVLSTKRLGG